jgi:hypothetical protein
MDRQKKYKRKSKEWPRTITVGSARTRVYRVKHSSNRNGVAYVVAYSTPAGRKTQKFADMSEALQEAGIIAERLAAGRVEGSEMSRGEREEYIAARALVGSHPLLSALQEWVRARELCGLDLIRAAENWRESNGWACLEKTDTESGGYDV